MLLILLLHSLLLLLLCSCGRRRLDSLGSALAPLTGLVVLDLSRNALRSLAGLESLARLEVLSVYMNQVSDAAELVRLRANGKLRSLDARLNPVTRSRFWRPFVLQSLPALQTLDAQQVMAAETRRAAARPPLAPNDLADRAAAESSDASDGEAEGGERALPAAPSWLVRAAPAAAAPAGAAPAEAAAPAGAAPAGAAPAGAAQAVQDPNLRHLGSSTRSSGSSRSDASSGAKSISSISVSSMGSSGSNSKADKGAFVATASGAPGASGAQAAAFAVLAAAAASTPGDEPLSPLDGVQLAEELNRTYDAVLASERSLSPVTSSSRSPSPSPSASRLSAPAPAPASSAASSAGCEPEPSREDDSLDGSLLKLLKFARRLEAPCSAQGWDTSMAELNECLVSVVACRKADKARAERDSAARLELSRALEARMAERDALAAALAAQRRELQRAEERAEGKPALEAASPEQLAAQRVPAMLLEAHNALIGSNRALLGELDDTRARYRADEEQWRANFDRLKALYVTAKEQLTTL